MAVMQRCSPLPPARLRPMCAIMERPIEIEVYYDGQCPICRLEVQWYTRMKGSSAIDWTDITALEDEDLPLARNVLLNRFHVRDHAGNWHVGVDAFARIWDQLDHFRPFSAVFRFRLTRPIAEISYRIFLRWQRWHRRRRHAGVKPVGADYG